MHRNFSCCVVSILAASLGGVGACQSADDEQTELQALLDDATLQQVPPGATATATGTGTASATVTAVDAVSRTEPAPLALAGPPPLRWQFDDCTPAQTALREAVSFFTNMAFRAVNVACVDGVQGRGVAIAATEDIVYVPDQPTFTFESGVTAAGWFKPASTSGTRTLVRKRDKGTSSFALVLNGGKFQFVVSFGNRAASVTAPTKARANVFQHVAGTYGDGVLRLYVDGAEVGSRRVAGTIPAGAGPLLMGNDGSERRFNGTIDSVAFATRALDVVEVQQLNCLTVRPTLVVAPETIPPTPVGVPVAVDIALTNNNPANCAPITFELQPFDGGLQLDPPPGPIVQSAPVASGGTTHMTLTATAPQSADPSDVDRTVIFQVREPTTNFSSFGFIPFPIAPTVGCHVDVKRELMITNLAAVNDPIRTRTDILPGDPRNGAWSIKRLFEDMAPTAADAPAMVEAMLTTFTAPRTINSFLIATRPGMQAEILANWPRIDGQLDLASAPLRLLAIVNRLDLRNLGNGDAGEGRFVFAFTRRDGTPFEATLILEYKLPAATEQDVLGWAEAFHALGALPPGESYNAALQAITDRFVRRGARPGRPNASAISSVRTNEIAFSDNGVWELRQFGLSPTTGLLVDEPLDLTPDRSFDNTDTLASYINANQEQIIAERHTVPATFAGQAFQGGAVFNDLTTWLAPGVDPQARHHFALNTCNGCHSLDETNTGFLQISPNEGEAFLSGFLNGTTVLDQVTQQPRFFDDLGRRKVDLEAIVCPAPSAQLGATLPNGTTLRQGIRRVH